MITEQKEYYQYNGKLHRHCLRKDGELHGEYKSWWNDGTLLAHCFLKDGVYITNEVTLLVDDIDNITAEEKMIIKLTHGINCL